MQKKTILHIIYNLGRGGAETMLVKVVKELHDYNNIIVTLFPENHFTHELKCEKYSCLNLKSLLYLPFASSALKKIIHQNKVDIVHSHLFWPTILARMATPKSIPLITTIHAFIASSLEYKKWYIRFLEKFTYNLRKNIIITVAKGALKEYYSFLKLKPYKSYSLHTFVDTKVFKRENALSKNGNGLCKIITVGALRKQKNHEYLLKAFKELDPEKFQLDIYGEGNLHPRLQQLITAGNLNVHLKGIETNIEHIIGEYDVYVMSSTYEGFSLSVLEAMAMKMPLLLSDIPSFREQCEDTALYFDLNDINDFALKLREMCCNAEHTKCMGEKAFKRVMDNFTLEQHIHGLRNIYAEVLFR